MTARAMRGRRKSEQKTRSIYDQVYDDEWLSYDGPFDLACCGCHLVHSVYIRRRKGRVQIRFALNGRATAALRRHHS